MMNVAFLFQPLSGVTDDVNLVSITYFTLPIITSDTNALYSKKDSNRSLAALQNAF